jgi:multidrug efflux pump subunit AcrB
MTGVSRQLFVPLSLAVAFSMISSYLLSSSLVPVFSTWLIRQVHHVEEGRGLFGRLRAFYRSYLQVVLRLRWPLVVGYLAVSMVLLYIYVPRMGTEIFPEANAPLVRVRLRLPTGTRIEETERKVLKALDLIKREAGEQNVLISSDFMGVQPPSYPVNLIHLFTSGPGEAIIQVSLKDDAPRGDALREKLRHSLQKELPGSSISFEAADIC